MWPWLRELWQGRTQHRSEGHWKLPDKQVWVSFVRSLGVGTAEGFLCFLWINTQSYYCNSIRLQYALYISLVLTIALETLLSPES